MGQIGRFIDDACAAHPALMQKVLDRPFGELRDWISFDEEGEACGCLVGTMALVAGIDAARARLDPTSVWTTVNMLVNGSTDAWAPVHRVGIRVFEVSYRLTDAEDHHAQPWRASPEANARTVDLIKRRIARSLDVQPVPPAVLAAMAAEAPSA